VKESIIHTFPRCNATVCTDGVSPFNGLTIDANGTLYGTVDLGGGASDQCGAPPAFGCGIVYKLTPNAQGKFTETILYRFQGLPTEQSPRMTAWSLMPAGTSSAPQPKAATQLHAAPMVSLILEAVASCSRLPRS
jgi:hypothetical protein